MPGGVTTLRMGKKKPKGGKHSTPRTPVQFPDEWLAVARARARDNQQPVLWFLIRLIKADAEANGITELPKPPWEQDDVPPKPKPSP